MEFILSIVEVKNWVIGQKLFFYVEGKSLYTTFCLQRVNIHDLILEAVLRNTVRRGAWPPERPRESAARAAFNPSSRDFPGGGGRSREREWFGDGTWRGSRIMVGMRRVMDAQPVKRTGRGEQPSISVWYRSRIAGFPLDAMNWNILYLFVIA